MTPMISLAHAIDRLNARFGELASWSVLIATVVSAGNATIRYAINQSSNAWLELQWYLFAVTVMLGAPLVLKANEHVRVDVVYGKLSPRAQAWVDLLGTIFFLMPGAILIAWYAWPFFLDSWVTGETSSNAGGLIRWPAKLLLPLGFAMLVLQGVSEIIKRIGYLRGTYAMDIHYEKPLQ